MRNELVSERSALGNESHDTSFGIQIFLSYSDNNKDIAGKLKSALKEYGVDAFLAREDIPAAENWEDAIVRNLDLCDAFVPIITKGFNSSRWANQETGYAAGSKKLIIPLNYLGGRIQPEGFLRSRQCIRRKQDYEQNAFEIAETILNKPDLAEKLRDGLVRLFGESASLEEATGRTERLLKFEGYSKQQLTDICRHIKSNDLLCASDVVSKQLWDFLKANKDSIESDLYRKTLELL